MSVSVEQMDEIQEIIRQKLKAEYEAHDRIVKRVNELSDIMDIALMALQDHSPSLSATLMKKAKKIFGKDQ